jgi:hypothetical protein
MKGRRHDKMMYDERVTPAKHGGQAALVQSPSRKASVNSGGLGVSGAPFFPLPRAARPPHTPRLL